MTERRQYTPEEIAKMIVGPPPGAPPTSGPPVPPGPDGGVPFVAPPPPAPIPTPADYGTPSEPRGLSRALLSEEQFTRVTPEMVFDDETARDLRERFGDVDIPLADFGKSAIFRGAVEGGSVFDYVDKPLTRALPMGDTQFWQKQEDLMKSALAVDSRALVENLRDALIRKELRTIQDPNSLSAEDWEDLKRRKHSEATTWYTDIRQRATGINPNATAEKLFRAAFVDFDPDETAWHRPSMRAIKQFRDENPVIGPLLAPLAALVMVGSKVDVVDPEGNVNIYNDGSTALNALDWFFRATSIHTYLSTAAVAGGFDSSGKGTKSVPDLALELQGWDEWQDNLGDRFSGNILLPSNWASIWRGWGTDEHLNLLQKGAEAMELSDRLGVRLDPTGATPPAQLGVAAEKMLEAAGISGVTGTTDRINLALGTLLLEVVTPDATSIGLGAAARAVKMGVQGIAKLTKADAASKYLARGALYTGDAAEILEEIAKNPNIDVQELVNKQVARWAAEGMSPSEIQTNRTIIASLIAQDPKLSDQLAAQLRMSEQAHLELRYKTKEAAEQARALEAGESVKLPEGAKEPAQGHGAQIFRQLEDPQSRAATPVKVWEAERIKVNEALEKAREEMAKIDAKIAELRKVEVVPQKTPDEALKPEVLSGGFAETTRTVREMELLPEQIDRLIDLEIDRGLAEVQKLDGKIAELEAALKAPPLTEAEKVTEALLEGGVRQVGRAIRPLELTPEQIDGLVLLEKRKANADPKVVEWLQKHKETRAKAIGKQQDRIQKEIDALRVRRDKPQHRERLVQWFEDHKAARAREIAKPSERKARQIDDLLARRNKIEDEAARARDIHIGPRREFSQDMFPRAQMRHAAVATLRRNLEVTRDLARRLGTITSKGARKADLSGTPEDIANEMIRATERVNQLTLEISGSTNLSEVMELEKLLGAAKQDQAVALYQMAEYDLISALSRLDDQIDSLVLTEHKLVEDLKELVELGKSAGFKDLDKVLNEHLKIVGRLEKTEEKIGTGYHGALQYAASLKTLGDQYKFLAELAENGKAVTRRGVVNEARNMGPGEIHKVAFAGAVEDARYKNRYSDARGFKKAMLWMADAAENFVNPAIARVGTSAEKIQQEYLAGMARLDAGRKEIDQLAEMSRLNKTEKEGVLIDYFDSTEAIRLDATKTTLLNTLDMQGRTRFQVAWDVLKAQIFHPEGMGGETRALDVILTSFLPKNEDARGIMDAMKAYNREVVKDMLESGINPKTGLEIGEVPSFRELLDAVEHGTVEFLSKQKRPKGAPPLRGTYQAAVDAERSKAVGLFAAATNEAAALSDTARSVRRLMTDKYATPAYDAAKTIVESLGNRKAMDALDVDAIADAFEILFKMGSDVNRSTYKTGLGRDIANGLARFGDEGNPESLFLPRKFMNDMAERLNNLAKQGQPYAGSILDPVDRDISWAIARAFRLFSVSMVSGLLFPRPAQFVTNFFGNFSQVWATSGLGPVSAAKFAHRGLGDVGVWASQSLAPNIPFIGKYLDEGFRAAMGPNGKLTPITAALANDHIRMVYDVDLFPNDYIVRGASGRELPLGEIRRAILDQRIPTTFASSSGLSALLARRIDPTPAQKWRNAALYLSRQYTAMGETLEQRQRIGLFTDLVLNEGKSFEEAGDLTRSALYDWEYPMTQLEADYLAKFFMFYTFNKRSLMQGINMLFDPITTTVKHDLSFTDIAKRSWGLSTLAGEPAFATTNIRDLVKSQDALKKVLAPPDEPLDYNQNGVIDEEDYIAHRLRVVSPWYASKVGSRHGVANTVLHERDQRYLSEKKAKRLTHVYHTVPTFTPLETTAFYTRFLNLFGMWAYGSALNTAAFAGLRDQHVPAPTVGEAFFEFGKMVADRGGPMTTHLMMSMLEGLDPEDRTKYYPSKGVKVYAEADKQILAGLNGMFGGGLMWLDPDQEKHPGVLRAHPAVFAIYKTIPVLGNEIPNTFEPILAMPPTRKENVIKGLSWLGSQYLGVGKEGFYDPQEVLYWHNKNTEDAVKKKIKALDTPREAVNLFNIDEKRQVSADQIPNVLNRYAPARKPTTPGSGSTRRRKLTKEEIRRIMQ